MYKRILFLIFTLIFLSASADAAVRLSVIPVDGGNSIRFGRIDLPSSEDKEVRVRMTSTDMDQYQVFQRIAEPFINERGETLDSDVLLAASLDGSNGSGTLYVTNLERIGFADQLIYTSSSQGVSDSFDLIYKIDPSLVNLAGQFSGKIIYTVRPIGGGSQDEIVLNLFMEATGQLKMNVISSSGLNSVRLNTRHEQDREGYVQFSFDGNRGPLKIYQEMMTPLVDAANNDLDSEMVQFMTSQGYHGALNYQEPSVLEDQPVLIYESSSPSDEVTVQFRIDPERVASQVASGYAGKIRYTFEGNTQEDFLDVDLDVKVEPIFEMEIDYPPEGMGFNNLLPNSPDQFREAVVTVRSNLGKPYVVNQNVRSLLTNEEGEQIKNAFFIKQEIMEGDGSRVHYPEFSPVPEGEAPLFFSDADGSQARFKVIYQLKPINRMSPGSYKASIVYSLEEI